MRIDHVLLTRFNLPSAGAESRIRVRAGWLRDRIRLFETYCLPSVAAQREAEVRWIIYLDPESPSWLVDRMQVLSRGGLFTPVYRSEVPRETLLEDLASITGQLGDVLLTSNLDNDDGLAVDYAARVQEAVGRGSRTALYVANGLIRHGGTLYRRRDPSNAFCSVAEPWEGALTCWADWHNRLGRTMPIRLIEGNPGWLQVVHDGNVSNRIRGLLVGPARYRDLYAAGVSDAEDPGLLKVIADRAWAVPARAVRDGARSAARGAIIGTVGKEGFDRLKSGLVARTRART